MSKRSLSVVAVFVLLAFGAAFAASNSTSLNLASPVTLAGTKLQPGSYKVTWTGEGENLTVIVKGNKTEVKAPAKAVKNEAPMAGTSYVTSKDGELSEIRPGGKATTLRFTDAQSASNKSSSTTSNP